MNCSAIERVADAILFEGYILYPYRPSSIKNRKRWNFGTLFPRGFVEADAPNESCDLHAEVLVQGPITSTVNVRMRFLELVPTEGGGGQNWQQGLVRTRDCSAALWTVCNGIERRFDLSDLTMEEIQRAPASRKPRPMVSQLSIRAESLSDETFRLQLDFANVSPAAGPAFVSAHLILQVQGGTFVSLLEPEEEFEVAVSQCMQRGVFPVLVSEPGDRTSLLCSPIILYDYPQVAPESAGDFFDSTEMDEMLALRVMTLTHEEKEEMRSGDPRARAILERTEALPQDHWMKIHGAVRGMRETSGPPADSPVDGGMEAWDPFAERPPVDAVRVFGVEVRKGDRVRLWPQKKADIIDMAMEGKVAIVEAIEQDLEDKIQFAVVLEEDPGRDMGMLRQAGHRFFFYPEEIEPFGAGPSVLTEQL
jgi:hypothetical protein